MLHRIHWTSIDHVHICYMTQEMRKSNEACQLIPFQIIKGTVIIIPEPDGCRVGGGRKETVMRVHAATTTDGELPTTSHRPAWCGAQVEMVACFMFSTCIYLYNIYDRDTTVQVFGESDLTKMRSSGIELESLNLKKNNKCWEGDGVFQDFMPCTIP